MPTATRTADPNGAADAASEAVAVGVRDLPVVVIDLERARRRYRALRDDFPWVDVHYDVSALAHPALLSAIAEADGGFEVTHDQALPALLLAGSAGRHVLHATPVAHPHEARAAYDAGVRRFVVDGARALEVFAGAPGDLRVVLKLQPALAPRPAHRAARGMSPAAIVAAASPSPSRRTAVRPSTSARSCARWESPQTWRPGPPSACASSISVTGSPDVPTAGRPSARNWRGPSAASWRLPRPGSP